MQYQAAQNAPDAGLQPFAQGGQAVPAHFDASELDVGYEVAFPFLTENNLTDAG
ncbi:hypothetical protein [Pelomonas sp. KK5]|uniref:hypothetical protein n=1 Tax=Pelomonas sp. KK5 TaxID=1855730 RepID=UPI001301B518|nr:hypothetical protein [Pelomonas sp. KK5]